jgi:hypothetical protein
MLKAGPPVTREVTVERDVPVRAPDGAALLTDVYLARPVTPLPVILMRTPYGRRGAHGTIARLFAERGYHAVVQSTRGTFGSAGQTDYHCEADDGRATADWIIEQPWSNGEIGGFGGSYLTFTQLALASTRPPQLKAMALGVWGAERRALYYPGNAFSLDRLGWAFVIDNQGKPLALVRSALRGRRALPSAFAHLPLLDADTVAVGHPVGYYRDWVRHDQPGDPYWTATDFRPVLRGLGIPVTMIGGWYDMSLPSMLADHQALREGGETVRLRVGAWHHASRGLFRSMLGDALDWFGAHLRGGPAPSWSSVRIETMGGGGWRELEQWPPPASVQRWHLQPHGALAMTVPPASAPSRYTYDPADPTPAVGGTSSSPSNTGQKDNRELERRPDVLTFTSEPLPSALEVTGPVTAELFVSSSRSHTDFFARLCDVDQAGRSMNITDALIRLTSASPQPQRIRVDLWPTAHQFREGHRIRLQVSSGAHPRYARNTGSGEPLATATTLCAAQQAVHHDSAHPSAVMLPVVPPAEARPDTSGLPDHSGLIGI